MYRIAKMYTDLQWSLDTAEDVYAFFFRREVHDNDAIVVEMQEDGIRTWIGSDFLERFEELFGREAPILEWAMPA